MVMASFCHSQTADKCAWPGGPAGAICVRMSGMCHDEQQEVMSRCKLAKIGCKKTIKSVYYFWMNQASRESKAMSACVKKETHVDCCIGPRVAIIRWWCCYHGSLLALVQTPLHSPTRWPAVFSCWAEEQMPYFSDRWTLHLHVSIRGVLMWCERMMDLLAQCEQPDSHSQTLSFSVSFKTNFLKWNIPLQRWWMPVFCRSRVEGWESRFWRNIW